MLVIAGPPGSGKSSVFPLTAFGQDAFNIDDRCAQIVGSYRAIPRAVRNAVARECERFVRQHIVEGTTFAVETTLRTRARCFKQAKREREVSRRSCASSPRLRRTSTCNVSFNERRPGVTQHRRPRFAQHTRRAFQTFRMPCRFRASSRLRLDSELGTPATHCTRDQRPSQHLKRCARMAGPDPWLTRRPSRPKSRVARRFTRCSTRKNAACAVPP